MKNTQLELLDLLNDWRAKATLLLSQDDTYTEGELVRDLAIIDAKIEFINGGWVKEPEQKVKVCFYDWLMSLNASPDSANGKFIELITNSGGNFREKSTYADWSRYLFATEYKDVFELLWQEYSNLGEPKPKLVPAPPKTFYDWLLARKNPDDSMEGKLIWLIKQKSRNGLGISNLKDYSEWGSFFDKHFASEYLPTFENLWNSYTDAIKFNLIPKPVVKPRFIEWLRRNGWNYDNTKYKKFATAMIKFDDDDVQFNNKYSWEHLVLESHNISNDAFIKVWTDYEKDTS